MSQAYVSQTCISGPLWPKSPPFCCRESSLHCRRQTPGPDQIQKLCGLPTCYSQDPATTHGTVAILTTHPGSSVHHMWRGLRWSLLAQEGTYQEASDCEALYGCFYMFLPTKAVHLEPVSDATTRTFVECLKRFVSRRGCPKDIYSDNGGNFVGARGELKEFFRMLTREDTTSAITSYLLDQRVQWHASPERAPHFGGLWEAAVKSAKLNLKKVVGAQRLTYEEFHTVLTQVEACLNSRPLIAVTSHSFDGINVLTPAP